jgi:hypothetical protein
VANNSALSLFRFNPQVQLTREAKATLKRLTKQRKIQE